MKKIYAVVNLPCKEIDGIQKREYNTLEKRYYLGKPNDIPLR